MIIFRMVDKFKYILSRRQKYQIIGLFFLMMIAGFMEMLSVSMMIPFVGTILQPETIMSHHLVQDFMRLFNIESYRMLLVYLSLIMALIYLIKNIFLVFQMTIQQRFVTNNCLELRKEIFKSYMARPYEFFINAKTGDIIRAITDDTGYAFSVLGQLISLAAEIIVSAILLITVLVISPFITIFMGIILISVTLLIYSFTRKRLQYHGKRSLQARGRMAQTIIQSIQGIKEIKLLRCENYFQDLYDVDGKIYVRADYIGLLLSLIPRFMLEAFAMCSFFVLVAILIFNGMDFESLIPPLSGIAVAAVRLLPSMNRISTALSEMAYKEKSVDQLIESLKGVRTESQKTVESSKELNGQIGIIQNKITGNNITFKYSSGVHKILENAGIDIYKGQSVGIVGASGAGKTTFVDVLLGLLVPQEGNIEVDGNDISIDLEGWTSQIGYIPQSIFMLDASIKQNVAFGIEEKQIDDERVIVALKEAALFDFVNELPEGIETQIGERGMRLSGGQRQRIGIARALYRDPEIIFLDEATSSLDHDTEAAIMESINLFQGKKTLIIIAHRLSTIEKCDVVYKVEQGKVKKIR